MQNRMQFYHLHAKKDGGAPFSVLPSSSYKKNFIGWHLEFVVQITGQIGLASIHRQNCQAFNRASMCTFESLITDTGL